MGSPPRSSSPSDEHGIEHETLVKEKEDRGHGQTAVRYHPQAPAYVQTIRYPSLESWEESGNEEIHEIYESSPEPSPEASSVGTSSSPSSRTSGNSCNAVATPYQEPSLLTQLKKRFCSTCNNSGTMAYSGRPCERGCRLDEASPGMKARRVPGLITFFESRSTSKEGSPFSQRSSSSASSHAHLPAPAAAAAVVPFLRITLYQP